MTLIIHTSDRMVMHVDVDQLPAIMASTKARGEKIILIEESKWAGGITL